MKLITRSDSGATLAYMVEVVHPSRKGFSFSEYPTQQSAGLESVVARSGCRLITPLVAAAHFANRIVTVACVNEVFDRCVALGIVDRANAWVHSEAGMFDIFFDVLDARAHGWQCGHWPIGGNPEDWTGKRTSDFDYVLLRWKTSSVQFPEHFTLADAECNEIYDSWDNEKAATKIEKLEVTRRNLYRFWWREK